MVIVGMNFSANKDGNRVTTLHCKTAFEPYYRNEEQGRGFVGDKVESVYVGDYDCSDLKVNDEIEIYFDKARTTKNGTYQPVKLIQVIK